MSDDGAVSVDLSNYELLWPHELFASEGQRILRASDRTSASSWVERAAWLITEALAGTTAVADFEELPDEPRPRSDALWSSTPAGGDTRGDMSKREWFTGLVNGADKLRYAAAPRPYWPQRHGSGLSHDGSTARDTRRDFARLITGFETNGYLAEMFGEACVDDDSELPNASEVIELRLGIPGLWPLAPETWDEETFYGLIEVFHDLVSRPRIRSYHPFDSCGWHHREFHNGPARILYRWKVNQLLRSAGIEYELAAEGEDLGRLVAVTDDARSQLVHRALNEGPADIAGSVRHAIALFRGRDTSAESKRSAIFNLGRILEARRALLKAELFTKDEGALFQIANGFDLRHSNAGQHREYNEAFLDWIFWWYLATVELTNRLVGSQGSA
ncbi:hypothetical protein [Streptomyces sp. NPDC057694]|uniref:hypothetical protein n=1 Tax=Streptomyces sp. NPDC057694 TaxID=3346216 RepID=UPI0036BBDD15